MARMALLCVTAAAACVTAAAQSGSWSPESQSASPKPCACEEPKPKPKPKGCTDWGNGQWSSSTGGTCGQVVGLGYCNSSGGYASVS